MLTKDCTKVTCPPERPIKGRNAYGYCVCSGVDNKGGVYRLTGRVAPGQGPMPTTNAWQPQQVPTAAPEGLGTLTGTAGTLVNLAVLALAVYGGVTLYKKHF